MVGAGSLQHLLGPNYTVTTILDTKGNLSFNIKRGTFDYTTLKYPVRKIKSRAFLEMIKLTVEKQWEEH